MPTETYRTRAERDVLVTFGGVSLDAFPRPDYEREGVRLYCGDCLEILPQLPAGCVDAVVTDPPYCSGGYLEAQKNTKAQGLRGATVSAEGFSWFTADNMSTGGLVWLLRAVLVCARKALVPNRSALVFTDWRMVPHLAHGLESSGLRFRNTIIWDKGYAGLGVGFKSAYECILEYAHGTPEYQSLSGQNVMRSHRVHATQKDHKAQKPVGLLIDLLKVVTAKTWCVLDPFMGVGSTGVACVKLGREFIGIEIERKYFDIAVRRIEAAIQQGPDDALFRQAEAKAEQGVLCDA